MRTTGTDRAWVGVLLAVAAGALMGAATGINMNQVRTASPGAVNVGGVAAAEGSSLAAARADHTHSLAGVLPVANGGTGNSSGQAATAAGLAGTSGSASSSTFLRGDWSWQAPPAQDWSVITGKPSTFPATTPVSTATALAANGSNCLAGQAAGGVDASGNSEACITPLSSPSSAAFTWTGGAATSGVTTTSSPLVTMTGAWWDGAASQSVPFSMRTNVTSTVPAYRWVLRDEQAGADRLTVNEAGLVAAAGGFSGALTGTASGNAPTNATYIVQTANGSLSNEQVLGALATGLLKVTTTTGVLSTAASGTDYGPPTSGAGTGVVVSTTGTGAHTTVAGTTTTLLHGNAAGAPTYASVDLSADTAATALPVGKGGLGASVTPAAGTIVYGSSGTAHAELAAGTAGAVLRSGGAAAPVWVAVQTCTSSASTTCTITVARSGCVPICMNATAVSTWVRGTVSTTTLTCTFSTSGTNTCNCLCP